MSNVKTTAFEGHRIARKPLKNSFKKPFFGAFSCLENVQSLNLADYRSLTPRHLKKMRLIFVVEKLEFLVGLSFH